METARRLAIGLALVTVLTLGAGTRVLASEPSPGGGPSFGQHAASMAPEHPLELGGADFGACVSALASGETCPHSH